MARKIAIGAVEVVPLPSGAKVRARRPSLLSIIAKGDMSAELTGLAWAVTSQDENLFDPNDPQSIARFAKVVEQYCSVALVSPVPGDKTELSEDADGVLTGTLNLADLEDLDKLELFTFASGKGRVDSVDLSQFRQESQRADGGSGRAEVQAAPVADSGDRSGGPDGTGSGRRRDDSRREGGAAGDGGSRTEGRRGRTTSAEVRS